MIEKRANPIDCCELKIDSANKKGEFEGYASVFGGNDSYNDTIHPGAFKSSIKSRSESVKMFVNHDSYQIPVGDWMHLEEDKKGLFGVGKIDLNHKDGPTLHSAMSRKAITGLSIGFRNVKGGWTPKEDDDDFGLGGRDIKKVDLVEISVVTFPADDSARVSAVKSEIQTIESLRDAELFLRESGQLSKSAAISFVSRLKSLIQSDSERELKRQITELEKKLRPKSVSASDFENMLGKYSFRR